jgi:hypothetical protein
MALTVPAGTLKSPAEQLTVVVVDSSGKKQERTVSKAEDSKLSFSGLKAGSAKIYARLTGATGGDLEAAADVNIVAGKQAFLELALAPVNGGGLDIVIKRPDNPKVPPADLKPDAKSLLGLLKVPQNASFAFVSKNDFLRTACTGFQTFVAFQAAYVRVTEEVCRKVESVGAPAAAPAAAPVAPGSRPETGGDMAKAETYTAINEYFLIKPSSIIGLANLLNSIQKKNRNSGPVSAIIACLPPVDWQGITLTHVNYDVLKTYSSLGSNGCANDGDFDEKQARDVHASILKFAKENNESISKPQPMPVSAGNAPATVK